MSYSSVIVGFLVAFLDKFREAWYSSVTYAIFKKLREIYYTSVAANTLDIICRWLDKMSSGSAICAFVARKDFFTRVWEHSRVFRFFNWLINVPSELCRLVYRKFEDAFIASYAYRLLTLLLRRFEVVIAVALSVIVVIPHNKWNNVYSTAAVAFLFALYFMKTVIQKYENFYLKAIDFALFVFIITVIMAEATSILPKDSLRFLTFYGTCFLLLLVIVSSIKSVRGLNKLIEIFLIGIAITGLYGIYQAKIVGIPVDPALTDVTLNEGIPGRLYSTMGNANNYAELLLLTLPFYLAVILNAKIFAKKVAYTLLAVPVLGALVLTWSRSAWGAFGVAMMVFIFIKNKKLIPLAMVVGIAAIPFLPATIIKRISTIFTGADSSAKYRELIYQTVAPMWRDFWATGVGLGTDPFIRVVRRYPLYMPTTPPHTHNLFLQIWLEMGLAGILSFVWFVVRIVKDCLKNIYNKTDEAVNNILVAGICAIVAISIMGMAEYVWFYPRVMLVFWGIMGVILAGLKILAKKKELVPEE